MLPGLQHVQDDAVYGPAQVLDGDVCQISQARGPPLRLLTEVFADVVYGVFQVIVADLVGKDVALWAHGAQQSHRQRARACTCFQHAGAHEDIAFDQDLCRILGVDDGGASRHGEHVVHHEVAEE